MQEEHFHLLVETNRDVKEILSKMGAMSVEVQNIKADQSEAKTQIADHSKRITKLEQPLTIRDVVKLVLTIGGLATAVTAVVAAANHISG